jgi:hypothetical protein
MKIPNWDGGPAGNSRPKKGSRPLVIHSATSLPIMLPGQNQMYVLAATVRQLLRRPQPSLYQSKLHQIVVSLHLTLYFNII